MPRKLRDAKKILEGWKSRGIPPDFVTGALNIVVGNGKPAQTPFTPVSQQATDAEIAGLQHFIPFFQSKLIRKLFFQSSAVPLVFRRYDHATLIADLPRLFELWRLVRDYHGKFLAMVLSSPSVSLPQKRAHVQWRALGWLIAAVRHATKATTYTASEDIAAVLARHDESADLDGAAIRSRLERFEENCPGEMQQIERYFNSNPYPGPQLLRALIVLGVVTKH